MESIEDEEKRAGRWKEKHTNKVIFYLLLRSRISVAIRDNPRGPC